MSTKVTFKTHAALTGRASIGYSKQSIDCKILRKTFGTIHAPTWETADNMYSISIMIIRSEEDRAAKPSDPCPWKNITFKARFEDPAAAKTWIQNNIEAMQQKYTLRFTED